MPSESTLRKSLIIIGASTVSLGVIGYSLVGHYGKLDSPAANLRLGMVLLALLPVVCTLLAKALLHVVILRHGRPVPGNTLRNLSAYAHGQIVRYVPGKLWGIIFQSFLIAGTFSSKAIWEANFIQYVMTNTYTIVMLMFLYSALVLKTTSFFPVIAGLGVLLYVVLQRGYFSMLFNHMVGLFRWKAPVVEHTKWASEVVVIALILLSLDWIFYFLAWYLILPESMSWADAVLIAGCYAAGALIGVAVFIMPSGILVREASFIWVGALLGYATDTLFVYSIVARILFTVSDVLLFAALYSVSTYVNRTSNG